MAEDVIRGQVVDAGNVHRVGWWRGFPHWWWWSTLALASLMLVMVLVYYPQAPLCAWALTSGRRSVPEGKWPNLLTVYLLGLVWGHILIQFSLYSFDCLTTLELKGDRELEDLNGRMDAIQRRPNGFAAAFVGAIEAVFYPTSLLLHRPEAIGAWLAFKVAGQWKTWESGHHGRRVFNRFLVGNAVSVAVGLLVYLGVRRYALC